MTNVTSRGIVYKLKVILILSSMFLDNALITYFGLTRCFIGSQIMRYELHLIFILEEHGQAERKIHSSTNVLSRLDIRRTLSVM